MQGRQIRVVMNVAVGRSQPGVKRGVLESEDEALVESPDL